MTRRPPRRSWQDRTGAVVVCALGPVLVAVLAVGACSGPTATVTGGTTGGTTGGATGGTRGATQSVTGTPGTSPAARPTSARTTRPPRTSPTPPDDRRPPFRASVSRVDAALAARMHASWRPGCPVPLADLRHLRLRYVDFEGRVRDGELVVHADVATGVVQVFERLYDLEFPLRSLRLVDDFGADDEASMAADNTSAFNCRAVTGGTAWSEHSYGRAIDVNPVENPYVSGTYVAPPAGRAFLDRVAGPGVILADDEVVRAFAAHGWSWGGYWTRPVDHQHFSTTNR
ncbi:M15 family metallopeptidase [Cellulomonas sp. PSBB021]|uniref:M15 family metallopeptidase n=1 Tax=Cellulomonas sp. PSBB021 TaxID=2003551 RepID=UPI000B8D4906|nr:M15 family metallopeptidase [Cellulomonas sp. PSBB021]ASR55436.1 hypothetical protein CBP52_10435 [Cellulomonas sp. PSBB021]